MRALHIISGFAVVVGLEACSSRAEKTAQPASPSATTISIARSSAESNSKHKETPVLHTNKKEAPKSARSTKETTQQTDTIKHTEFIVS